MDDTRTRFEELLPWYVNGTLGASDRAWVDSHVARQPDAADALAAEQVLAQQARAAMPKAAGEAGLERLLQKVREERSAEAAPHASRMSWLDRFFRPPVALALAGVVAVQAGAMVWLATLYRPTDEWRSPSVSEVRTLRVRFVAGATEAQIRDGLVAAGARIVGGPTPLGEYWVASSQRSLDEVRDALVHAALIDSAEVDVRGPQGR